MKKLKIEGILALLLLTFPILASSLRNIYAEREDPNWTFMVYLDADNNLERFGIDNFLQMASVGSTSNVNIVVQMDRVDNYDDRYDDWTSCKRFRITKDMTPTAGNAIEDLGEVNMGDPATLRDFIIWTMQNYPANHYCLVLWDHGAGFKCGHKGVCSDESSASDHLTMTELKQALGGIHIDVIGFDACLMGMVEVAYQIKHYTDYIVASEEEIPGTGWPYDRILSSLISNPTMSGSTLSSTIVAKYGEYYGSGGVHPSSETTMAAVRTICLDELVRSVDNFAQTLKSKLAAYKTTITQSRDNAEWYTLDASAPDLYDLFIDLYHFAQLIKQNIGDSNIQSAASNVMNALTSVVISEWHYRDGGQHPNSHGLTIYFTKQDNPNRLYDTEYDELDFSKTTQWDEFLKLYLGITFVGISPVLQGISRGSTATYSVVVCNPGTAIDTINLQVVGVPQGWSATLSQQSVTLDGGALTTVILSVNSPSTASIGDSATISVIGNLQSDPTIRSSDQCTTIIGAPPTTIQSGLVWLRCHQNLDGSWTYHGSRFTAPNVGLTALATLAFINYGFTESDSAVSKAINYILSNVKSDGSIWSHYPVYDTSMSVITLLANRDIANKYHSIIENAKNFLISAQNVEPDFPFTDRFYGGWPYSKGQYWADLSNTQFALLALYEARRAGFTVPDDVFNKAATFVTRCQNLKATNPSFSFYDDGGFIYQPGSTIWANGMSYASMTAAGVWSLHCCGISSTDVRVKAGLKWLATNYYVDRNYPIGNTWLYYYLFSAAKAYFLTGTITIDGHDWYADISEYLKNRQAADGRWISIFHEEPDELATVEAILALETKAPPRISRLVTFKVDSPADLHIYDPLNRHVGINYVTGEIEIEVPNSTYSGPGTEPQIITVADPVAGTYRVELVGKATGPYTLRIEGVVDSTLVYTESYSGAINIGEVHASEVTISAIVGPLTIWATSPTFVKVIDNIPPTTTLTLGNPKYVENGNTYVNSATLFTLIATDNPGGTGVSETAYRIYNSSYNTGWLNYTSPFCLIGLSDGTYNIDYNSTDNVGNVETTNTATVILDNTGPLVTIVNPTIGWALQDGVTFLASAVDSGCGVSSLNFSIRESNGAGGIPVGFEDIPATYNATTDKWTLFFDTLLLPDGYYVVLARAKDNLGNVGPSSIVPYSIRNWAIIELLPASESNKAGRTMPVKFALRVAASVDPLQPFVYNEELVIRIYATCNPNVILQESRFGDTAKDYRINTIEEHYITNFKTLKTPMEYTVTVYRDNFEIGGFTFKTVK